MINNLESIDILESFEENHNNYDFYLKNTISAQELSGSETKSNSVLQH